MANGGDRHAEGNRTEGSKVLLRRLVLVEGGQCTGPVLLRQKFIWAPSDRRRGLRHAGPDADTGQRARCGRRLVPGDAETVTVTLCAEIESHGTDS